MNTNELFRHTTPIDHDWYEFVLWSTTPINDQPSQNIKNLIRLLSQMYQESAQPELFTYDSSEGMIVSVNHNEYHPILYTNTFAPNKIRLQNNDECIVADIPYPYTHLGDIYWLSENYSFLDNLTHYLYRQFGMIHFWYSIERDADDVLFPLTAISVRKYDYEELGL